MCSNSNEAELEVDEADGGKQNIIISPLVLVLLSDRSHV
jgi:hypothetical protein